jgi:uncharacterized protein (TIGR02246 family)
MAGRICSAIASSVLACALLGCTQSAPQAPRMAATPASEATISAEQATAELAKARAEFIAAYNTADLDRFVALFTPDATYAGLRQTTWVKGTDEIRSMWGVAFKKDPGRNFEYPQPLTYLSPDHKLAIDSGYAEMMMSPRANATIQQMQHTPMRASVVWVRTDTGWKIQSMSVSPRAPVAAGFLPGH